MKYRIAADKLHIVHFVVGDHHMRPLVREAQARLQTAFRPKTRKCYAMLFRSFLAFCVHYSICVHSLNVTTMLAYFEFLAKNKVSVNMLANHTSALKASFVLYGLNFSLLDHPQIKYFLKSFVLKTSCPLMPFKPWSQNVTQFILVMCSNPFS